MARQICNRIERDRHAKLTQKAVESLAVKIDSLLDRQLYIRRYRQDTPQSTKENIVYENIWYLMPAVHRSNTVYSTCINPTYWPRGLLNASAKIISEHRYTLNGFAGTALRAKDRQSPKSFKGTVRIFIGISHPDR